MNTHLNIGNQLVLGNIAVGFLNYLNDEEGEEVKVQTQK
jgi:hypothetical protein